MEVQLQHEESGTMKKVLLTINCLLLSVGTSCGPLISRLYFLHGGKRIWLSGWLQSAGCPFNLIPLTITYLHRRRKSRNPSYSTTTEQTQHRPKAKLILITPQLFAASAIIGTLNGFDNFLYSNGLARLPVSTSSLIVATQLAFTAGFAFLLVRQRFTSYSINAVVLLTLGAGVLALHASGDCPEGESKKDYIIGFVMTLAACAMYGFILPITELIYKKAKQPITYSLVMEIQLVMGLFATLFSTVGMLVNNDFKVIPREARNYELGETKYYVVLVWNAMTWQIFYLGAVGVVFSASSLLSGIIIAFLLPATEILAVIFYKEKFQAEKGVALALSLWGFVSYFYGEVKQIKKARKNHKQENEMSQISDL